MRRHAVAVLLLALAASTTHAAQAKQACPTLTDEAGDTGVFGFHVQEDASDITSVDISTANRTLTASVTVVGKPVNNEPGVSRMYEVYFDTGESDYVLRGSLGNGESRFELVTHDQVADSGLGTTVDHWQAAKTIQGRVHDHTVTITAPLDRDLPMLGRRVQVAAATKMAEANEMPVGGVRVPTEGVTVGVDVSQSRDYRVGDRGCA